MIQIASLVTNFGEKEPVVRNILTLKSCAPISGAGECRGEGAGCVWGKPDSCCVGQRLLPPHKGCKGCAGEGG